MGQPAQTRWRVLGRGGDFCWLELKPLTGRTHQLRVHCASEDFPIFGDPVYGAAAPGERLHLHARAISIPISANRPAVEVEACVPDHMKDLLAACGWTPALDEAAVAARAVREAEQLRRAAEAGASNPPDA
jgi:tRNA pseudouridine32 synthase / 23S rRNA pseudouridine746 synthase